jgi:hypothetical protein
MILNRLGPAVTDLKQSQSCDDMSRRTLLHAGTTVGGGLLLSLYLPFM